MQKEQYYEELFSKYRKEFSVVLDKCDYTGPVLFFDLRRKNLQNLGISCSEEVLFSLVEMFDYFIRRQEQMNSFILCDEVSQCRLYSTNQILRLLNGQNFNPDYSWHKIFPNAEILGAVPEDAYRNFALAEWYVRYGNAFACMTFKEIPASYFRFNEEIVGVENYLPEVMYFLMENIKKGCYPHVDYPYLYKATPVAGFLPELVYWHYETGSTNWKNEIGMPKMLSPQEDCDELFSKYKKEFGCILEVSDYKGPVLILDLRRQNLQNWGISCSEEMLSSLVKMFDYFICRQEQMNSFILCDEATQCRFYSTNQILRLLNGQDASSDYNWHKIFPYAEIHRAFLNDAQDDSALGESDTCFAYMTFKEIPASYFKFGKNIVGVENYLPEVMYFLMENIKKGCYPKVNYPYLYKPNVVAGFLPELFYWHLDVGTTNREEGRLPLHLTYSSRL